MIIERIELSAARLEGLFKFRADRCVRLIFGECFKIREWAEDVSACALNDDAIGVIVGKLKDGRAATRALYISDDGALSHGPLCVDGAKHTALAASQK